MTKPVKVLTRWERFKRMTVWHPLNTDPTDDDRWTVRVWLPAYDIIAFVLGIIAYFIGSPLLNRLFDPLTVDIVGVVFSILGFIAFVGVVLPRFWRLELIGKVGMSFLLTTYAGLVLAFPSQEAQNNSFITLVVVMATWGIYPRLTKLFIRSYREAHPVPRQEGGE